MATSAHAPASYTHIAGWISHHERELSDLAFWAQAAPTGPVPDGWEQRSRAWANEFARLGPLDEDTDLPPACGIDLIALRSLVKRTARDALQFVTLVIQPQKWGVPQSEWPSAGERQTVDNMLNAAEVLRTVRDVLYDERERELRRDERDGYKQADPPQPPKIGPYTEGKAGFFRGGDDRPVVQFREETDLNFKLLVALWDFDHGRPRGPVTIAALIRGIFGERGVASRRKDILTARSTLTSRKLMAAGWAVTHDELDDSLTLRPAPVVKPVR